MPSSGLVQGRFEGLLVPTLELEHHLAGLVFTYRGNPVQRLHNACLTPGALDLYVAVGVNQRISTRDFDISRSVAGSRIGERVENARALVFNFQVKTGTYAAGGFIVHNKEDCLEYAQYHPCWPNCN